MIEFDSRAHTQDTAFTGGMTVYASRVDHRTFLPVVLPQRCNRWVFYSTIQYVDVLDLNMASKSSDDRDQRAKTATRNNPLGAQKFYQVLLSYGSAVDATYLNYPFFGLEQLNVLLWYFKHFTIDFWEISKSCTFQILKHLSSTF